jgi:hypothetical protein
MCANLDKWSNSPTTLYTYADYKRKLGHLFHWYMESIRIRTNKQSCFSIMSAYDSLIIKPTNSSIDDQNGSQCQELVLSIDGYAKFLLDGGIPPL